MTHHVILLVCSDLHRLRARHGHVRQAGHHALPAETTRDALRLLAKVRIALVLTDVELADGRAHQLVREMRRLAHAAHITVVVLGDLTPEDQRALAADAHVHTRPLRDEAALPDLLDAFLAA